MYQQTDIEKSENEIVRKVQIVRKVKMVRKSNGEKSQKSENGQNNEIIKMMRKVK